MSDPSPVVMHYYEAFNRGDLEDLRALMHKDITYWVDSQPLQGRDAAYDFISGLARTFTGIRATPRVLVQCGSVVVCETTYENSTAGEEDEKWVAAGKACDVFGIRDGAVFEMRNYYVPNASDRVGAEPAPTHVDAWRLVEEQTALRRVATLVAEGAPEAELFSAVNEGIAQIVGADATSLFRFEPDDRLRLLAAYGDEGTDELVDESRPLNPELREMLATGQARRFDVLPEVAPFLEESKALGIHSSVGVPIAVDGRVWGVTFASSTRHDPLPSDTERRIAGFTELVAIALANAQARAQLEQVADEQAALRRVAELITRETEPAVVAAAVTLEATRVLGADIVRVERSAADDAALASDERDLVAKVRATGGPDRVDSPAGAATPRTTVGAPVVVGGELWGILIGATAGRRLPVGTEHRLRGFADLLASAIRNEASRAQLTASRARVVATADATRRQIQRDVHDGAQQRLVHAVITLKLLRDALQGADERQVALAADALRHAELASAALRDLVHGIMPASLSNGGLRAGLEELVSDQLIPVELTVSAGRLAPEVETTAYFVVAEALTNVVKHARAQRAQVEVVVDGGELVVRVVDDGVGGADAEAGTGLTGLFDRVGAADGVLELSSVAGVGTRLEARLPVG